MDQIPGLHFNFVKGILYDIDFLSGIRCFYRSLLTGDLPTDNIPGIYGLGPVKAGKMINPLLTAKEMHGKVLEEYQKSFKEEAERLLTRNAHLLYIRPTEGREWVVPTGE